MLASIGGSLDSLDEASAAGPPTGAPYSSFDGDDASFLMALRQSKRKSIRQVGARGAAGRGWALGRTTAQQPLLRTAASHNCRAACLAGGVQERKKAAQEGLRFLRLTGSELQEKHWDFFFKCYRNTTGCLGLLAAFFQGAAGHAGMQYRPAWPQVGLCTGAPTACHHSSTPAAADRKWGSPYLTRDFFSRLGERMADRVLLVLAETAEGKPVAGALNLIGSDALYGRNWGSIYGDRVPFLHFEVSLQQASGSCLQLQSAPLPPNWRAV